MLTRSKWLKSIVEYVQGRDGTKIIPICAEFEKDVAAMDEAERKTFLKKEGVPSQLGKVIKEGFKALNLIYFFTTGKDEVKCKNIYF